MKLLTSLVGIALSLSAGAALALGPAPAPLKDKATLTVGYVKVGHLSPMLMVEEELKKMNIEVKRAEFVPVPPCCPTRSTCLPWAQVTWPSWPRRAART